MPDAHKMNVLSVFAAGLNWFMGLILLQAGYWAGAAYAVVGAALVVLFTHRAFRDA